MGGLGLLTMLPVGFKAQERYAPKQEQEPSIRDILLSLVRNKYLLIYTLSAVVGSITDFTAALNAYVAIHCMGDPSYITLLSLATAVPVLFVVLFVPRLLEKVENSAHSYSLLNCYHLGQHLNLFYRLPECSFAARSYYD